MFLCATCAAVVHLFLQLRLAVHFPWPTMDFEWCGEFIVVDSTGRSDHWCCLLSIEGSFSFDKWRLDFLAFFLHGRGT